MKKNTKKKNFAWILTLWDYLNPLAGIHELYLVIKYYWILRKTMFSDIGQKMISDYNKSASKAPLRVDNLGRIYTVINIPHEIKDNDDSIMLLWKDEMKSIDKGLIPLGITDFIAPYNDFLYDEDKDSYYMLVIIKPNTSFFSLGNIVFELLKIIGIITFIIYLL